VVFSDFAAAANRFRTSPVESIVKSNLVLQNDAANANGLASYSNGCANDALPWANLAASGNEGTLTGFSSCSTHGWQGAGTPADPKSLTFNGSNSVSYGTIDFGNTLTLSAWVHRPTEASGIYTIFANSTGGPATNGFKVWVNTGATMDRNINVELGNGSSGGVQCATTANNFTLSRWHHLAVTLNKSTGACRIYLNGTQVGSSTLSVTNFSTNANFLLGRMVGDHFGFVGSVANVAAYTRDLSATEVRQNCAAQAARYGVTDCAAP